MDANARTLPPTRLSGWQQSLGVRVEPTHHPTWVRRVDFPFASVLAKAQNFFRPPPKYNRKTQSNHTEAPTQQPSCGRLTALSTFSRGKKG